MRAYILHRHLFSISLYATYDRQSVHMFESSLIVSGVSPHTRVYMQQSCKQLFLDGADKVQHFQY